MSGNSYHVVQVQNTMDTVLFDGLFICCGNANAGADTTGGGMHISSSNAGPVIVKQCNFEGNNAVAGSSLYNSSATILENSILTNETPEVATGCSILNTGTGTSLTLINTSILQHCTNCFHIIKSADGAHLIIYDSVNIERD